ncbi:MAG: DUF5018 domain-containing protein [Bacteroides clarus]|nr:PCMD domain-containing protein [Bacteroides clarus]MBD9144579.1 DUF5018 domain-containing protein [Bacteroides clarus]SHG17773.1 protein of unknown function [Bacteroides clarus YIT 12056]
MKKNLFYLFALICSMSLFTACSDDDDTQNNSKVIEEVAGDYKGLMNVYYEEPDVEIAKDMQQKITIKKSSDTSIGLELKNFVITIAGTPLPIGDLAIDNCPLKVESNKYSFTGSANLDLIVGKCAVSVEGAINGEDIELIIKVNVDNGSMKVRVEYRGHKMTGSESSEALIKEFKFDSDIIAEQPVINEDNTITFKVVETATADDLKTLKPIITISENATVSPEPEMAQDFSDNKVVIYKVTSEDGTTVTEYKVSARKSSDAFIVNFVFENNPFVVEQPVINEDNTITFKVKASATADDLRALVPTITYSHKATVVPKPGVAQDFSDNKKVVYTVTSEDGTVIKEYQVFISGTVENKVVYDFEKWVAGVEGQEPEMTFYEPEGWASSNTGAHFLKALQLADSYVIMQTDNARSGSAAAKIQSIDTKGKDMYFAKAPKVTTGSLFLGKFITDTGNTLNSTKFGIPYEEKPISLRGWYKYVPGDVYYIVNTKPYKDNCHNAVIDNTKIDEFMISVVLYETTTYDETDWSDCLTGTDEVENNIYTSSRIAAIGQLTGGAQSSWKKFELPLEWKKLYDANKKYRMTITCSSSKDGDKFWGAPGSTLIVDDFELVRE